MKCVDCAYFWKEEDESHPQCHWLMRAPDDFPPCEEEDYASEYEPEDFSDYEREGC